MALGVFGNLPLCNVLIVAGTSFNLMNSLNAAGSLGLLDDDSVYVAAAVWPKSGNMLKRSQLLNLLPHLPLATYTVHERPLRVVNRHLDNRVGQSIKSRLRLQGPLTAYSDRKFSDFWDKVGSQTPNPQILIGSEGWVARAAWAFPQALSIVVDGGLSSQTKDRCHFEIAGKIFKPDLWMSIYPVRNHPHATCPGLPITYDLLLKPAALQTLPIEGQGDVIFVSSNARGRLTSDDNYLSSIRYAAGLSTNPIMYVRRGNEPRRHAQRAARTAAAVVCSPDLAIEPYLALGRDELPQAVITYGSTATQTIRQFMPPAVFVRDALREGLGE